MKKLFFTTICSLLAIVQLSCYSPPPPLPPVEQVSPTKPDNALPQVFPIVGWDTWGGLQVSEEPTHQKVTFMGEFKVAAGYVIERDMPFGGQILKLNITGSSDCVFDHYKMFKFEANNKPISPIEGVRKNLNDSDYINAGDGTVSFRLPSPLYKLQFVFWNATLKELTISGAVE